MEQGDKLKIGVAVAVEGALEGVAVKQNDFRCRSGSKKVPALVLAEDAKSIQSRYLL